MRPDRVRLPAPSRGRLTRPDVPDPHRRVAVTGPREVTAMRAHRQQRAVRPATLVLAVLLGACLLLGAPSPRAQAEEMGAWAWSDRTEGLAVRGLSALAIHLHRTNHLLAHVHGLGLAESRDGGATWQVMAGAPAAGPDSRVRFTMDPKDEAVLYVVVDGRVHRSDDDGATFHDITTGSLATYSWDKRHTAYASAEVVIDGKKNNSLLVGTMTDGWHHGGLFQSTDGGKTWEAIAGSDIGESGLGSDVPWIRRDPKTDKNVAAVGPRALYWSDKGGTLFKRLALGGKVPRPYDLRALSASDGDRDLYVCDPRGVWHSKDTGKSWSKDPIVDGDAVAAEPDPTARRVFVVLWDRGLHIAEKGKVEQVAEAGDDPGHAGAEFREIAPHPRDRKRVYAASPVAGLWRSEDDGMTFTSVSTDLPALPERLERVAVHPAAGHVHLAAGASGRIYRSTDHGATWSHVGRAGMAVRDLIPGRGPGIWWVAGRRLLRSTDDGATWESRLELTEEADEAIVRLIDHKGTWYALLAQTGRVVTSQDGLAWNVPKLKGAPLDGTAPAVALAVDPQIAGHLVIAAASPNPRWTPADQAGGIYESWDNGATWEAIHKTLLPRTAAPAEAQRRAAWWNHAAFLHIDPTTGMLLYGAHRRGVLARRSVPPTATPAERKAAFTGWVDVSPAEALRPAPEAVINASALEVVGAGDGVSTQLVMQLQAMQGATTLLRINCADLSAAWEAGRAAATPPNREEPPSAAVWSVGADPGTRLGQLAVDPAFPGRLVGVDGRGRRGVLVWERPGMTEPPPPEEPSEEPPVEEPAAPAPGEAPAPGDPPSGPSPEAPAPGDAPAPGTPAPDVPAPGGPAPDAPAPGTPGPDAPAPEAPAPEKAPEPPPGPSGGDPAPGQPAGGS